jgi:hypothetical protein
LIVCDTLFTKASILPLRFFSSTAKVFADNQNLFKAFKTNQGIVNIPIHGFTYTISDITVIA